MKILIDTSEIKDQYSLYYCTSDLTYEDDFKYYATIAEAMKDYIKNMIAIRGYVTIEKCFERLQGYIGGTAKDSWPIEFMFAGYANSDDVDVQCVLSDNRYRYRFDFLNVKDISLVLLNEGVISRRNIIREGYIV